jgi:hypothetical protein
MKSPLQILFFEILFFKIFISSPPKKGLRATGGCIGGNWRQQGRKAKVEGGGGWQLAFAH